MTELSPEDLPTGPPGPEETEIDSIALQIYSPSTDLIAVSAALALARRFDTAVMGRGNARAIEPFRLNSTGVSSWWADTVPAMVVQGPFTVAILGAAMNHWLARWREHYPWPSPQRPETKLEVCTSAGCIDGIVAAIPNLQPGTRVDVIIRHADGTEEQIHISRS